MLKYFSMATSFLREAGETNGINPAMLGTTVSVFRSLHERFETSWQEGQARLRSHPERPSEHPAVFASLLGLLWASVMLHVRLRSGYGDFVPTLASRLVVVHWKTAQKQYDELAEAQNNIKRLAQDIPNEVTRFQRASPATQEQLVGAILLHLGELEETIVHFFRTASLDDEELWQGLIGMAYDFRWEDGFFHAEDDGTLIAPAGYKPFDITATLVAAEKRRGL